MIRTGTYDMVSMERMTFTVPGDVKQRARRAREVNWSAVVTKAIEDRLDLFDKLEALTRNRRISQAEVDALGKAINQRMAKHYRRRRKSSSSTRTGS